MRLDQFIARKRQISTRSARTEIVAGRVTVDGQKATDHRMEVSRFLRVQFGPEILQPGMPRLMILLHKPAGVVSATSDEEHRTVLDLVDHPDKHTLHLAGRLDRSSTGLVLLTNDGHWSESLTQPGQRIEKEYLVKTVDPIPPEAVDLFAAGFEFQPENIRTLPAKLEILGERRARVTLVEGRYHQIKRMFHRVRENRLTALHRVRIGPFRLGDLPEGAWEVVRGDSTQ